MPKKSTTKICVGRTASGNPCKRKISSSRKAQYKTGFCGLCRNPVIKIKPESEDFYNVDLESESVSIDGVNTSNIIKSPQSFSAFIEKGGAIMRGRPDIVIMAANMPEYAKQILNSEHASEYQKAVARKTLKIRNLSASKKKDYREGRFPPEHHDSPVTCNRLTRTHKKCENKQEITYLKGWCGLCMGYTEVIYDDWRKPSTGKEGVAQWRNNINLSRIAAMSQSVLEFVDSKFIKSSKNPCEEEMVELESPSSFSAKALKILSLVDRYSASSKSGPGKWVERLARGNGWDDVAWLMTDEQAAAIKMSRQVLIDNKASCILHPKYSIIDWSFSENSLGENEFIRLTQDCKDLIESGCKIREVAKGERSYGGDLYPSEALWECPDGKINHRINNVMQDPGFIPEGLRGQVYWRHHQKREYSTPSKTPVEKMLSPNSGLSESGHIDWGNANEDEFLFSMPAQNIDRVVDNLYDMEASRREEMRNAYTSFKGAFSVSTSDTGNVQLMPVVRTLLRGDKARDFISDEDGNVKGHNLFYTSRHFDGVNKESGSFVLHGSIAPKKRKSKSISIEGKIAEEIASLKFIDLEAMKVARELARDAGSDVIEVKINSSNEAYFDCSPRADKAIGLLVKCGRQRAGTAKSSSQHLENWEESDLYKTKEIARSKA